MTKAGTWQNRGLDTNIQRVRSSLAVIESGRGGDQNVSTLQKFTAECSLSTLNGRITMTVCSKKSTRYNGLFTKEQHDSLNRDKLLTTEGVIL